MKLLDIFDRSSRNYVATDETITIEQQPLMQFIESWTKIYGITHNNEDNSLDSEILSLMKFTKGAVHTRICLTPETGIEEGENRDDYELFIRIKNNSELAEVLYYKDYDDDFAMYTPEVLLLLTRWLAQYTYPSRHEAIKNILADVQKSFDASEAAWSALEPKPPTHG